MKCSLACREKVNVNHKFVLYEKNIQDSVDRVMHSVLFPYRVVSPYYLYCSGVHDLFPFSGHYVDAAI